MKNETDHNANEHAEYISELRGKLMQSVAVLELVSHVCCEQVAQGREGFFMGLQVACDALCESIEDIL